MNQKKSKKRNNNYSTWSLIKCNLDKSFDLTFPMTQCIFPASNAISQTWVVTDANNPQKLNISLLATTTSNLIINTNIVRSTFIDHSYSVNSYNIKNNNNFNIFNNTTSRLWSNINLKNHKPPKITQSCKLCSMRKIPLITEFQYCPQYHAMLFAFMLHVT